MNAIVKTTIPLALAAAAFALAGCNSQYHAARDPYMKLSTPPTIYVPPEAAQPPDTTVTGATEIDVRGNGVSTPPPIKTSTTIVEGPGSAPTPMVVAPPDLQMLGQPGKGPAIMAPNYETMPESGPVTVDDVYPRSR